MLMFLDIGGTMDDHIKLCEELFSAAKTSSSTSSISLPQLPVRPCVEGQPQAPRERTRTFGPHAQVTGNDYKLVFVGDPT